jgi:transcriptional regulator with XRE-family HTH domain
MIWRLKELRVERGISQEELSEMSGISRPVISKMENDEVGSATAQTILALSNALQVEPGDLFCPRCHQ